MALALSLSVVVSSVVALIVGVRLLKTSDDDLMVWRSQGYRSRIIYAPGLKTKARMFGVLLVLMAITIVLGYVFYFNG